MKNSPKYIDSNIILNAILYDDKKAERCKQIISDIVNLKFEALTSSLTWDEVVYILKKNLGKEAAIKGSSNLLNMPNLNFVSIDRKVLDYADSLIKIYNLKPRDATHAASAIINNCSEIISDDSDFDQIKEIKRIPVD